jgi:hypothetical protein
MPRFLEVKQYLATPYEKQFVMSGHICSVTRQIYLSYPSSSLFPVEIKTSVH